jgi:hypothetical protein
MYNFLPKRVKDQCFLCAFRGGYEGCDRSKNPEIIRKANKILAGRL